MNDLLSITVDKNIKHGTRAKTISSTCTKMRINE